MNSLARCLLVLTAALACTPSQAQFFRTYLASDGNDANPCTLQLPCRLLPAAITAVASGGEIWMLDSANYNTSTVNVTKSVSIRAVPGAVGSIVVLGGHGLTVSADGLDVYLRNVSIGPVATSPPTLLQYGAVLSGASTLTLDGCLVADLPGEGVRASAGMLKIVDSVIRGIGNNAVNVNSVARASIARTRILKSGVGVLVYGSSSGETVIGTVSDSTISGTGSSTGVVTSLNALNAIARLSVSRTQIDGHEYGVRARNLGGLDGVSAMSVSGSTIVSNNYAFYQFGIGTSIVTNNNNHVADNASASVGAIGYLPPQ
jgi:hypothetical protein